MRGGQRPNCCTDLGVTIESRRRPRSNAGLRLAGEGLDARRVGVVRCTLLPPYCILQTPCRHAPKPARAMGVDEVRRAGCGGGLHADVGRDNTPFARWHRPGPRVWGARPRAAPWWQTPRLSLGRRGRLGHDVCGCVAAGDVRLPSDDGTQLPPTNAHGTGPETVDSLPRHK